MERVRKALNGAMGAPCRHHRGRHLQSARRAAGASVQAGSCRPVPRRDLPVTREADVSIAAAARVEACSKSTYRHGRLLSWRSSRQGPQWWPHGARRKGDVRQVEAVPRQGLGGTPSQAVTLSWSARRRASVLTPALWRQDLPRIIIMRPDQMAEAAKEQRSEILLITTRPYSSIWGTTESSPRNQRLGKRTRSSCRATRL